MTLDQNIRLFRKWWWLILLAAVVAGGVGYFLRHRQPPTYQASAILAFGNVIGNASPDTGTFTIGTDLAQAYSQLILTDTIINSALHDLHLPISPDQLRRDVDWVVIPNTALLQVMATYNDPQIAASIANEIVDQLLLNAPTDISDEQKQQSQQITDQITQLNKQISDTQGHLAAINNSLQAAQSASDIADLTAQRDGLASQLTSLQSTLATLESTLEQIQGRRNLVQIYERASVPTGPQPNGAAQSGMLAAAVAASLTIGIVLIISYFDNENIYSPAAVEKALDLPVLGTIRQYGNRQDSYRQKLATLQPPPGDVLQSYRLLFMRLVKAHANYREALSAGETFIVSSPAPGDGKSVVSANLAVTASLFGLRVLLIDADMYQPTLHKFFGLPNTTGLAELITNVDFVSAFSALPALEELPALEGGDNNHLSPSDEYNGANHPVFDDQEWDARAKTAPFEIQYPQSYEDILRALFAERVNEYIQRTEFQNVSVITTGSVGEWSAKELGLVFRRQWIPILKACAQADLVIMDTPPCLAVSDSSILAAKSGARVLLVLGAGKTSLRTAYKAKAQFVQVAAKVEGLILNMVDKTDIDFDYKNYSAKAVDQKQ